MEVYTIVITILLAGALLYYFVTDPLSFLFFMLLLGILFYVLVYFGFLDVQSQPTELDINYTPRPVPQGGAPQPGREIRTPLQEVFYIADNIFTYDQAPNVCKAYGGDIATYDQVEDAYNRGAEWCGYGWTAGGLALFPTQEETWRKLQLEVDPAKRIACGRPGVNGGYFDPAIKFGVNCYGIRPEKPKGANDADKQIASAVARFKRMLDKLSVYPFSGQDWSEYTGISQTIVNAESDIRGLGADIKKGGQTLERSVSDVGGGIVEGTGTTINSVASLVSDAGKNLIEGVGSFGQTLYKSVGRYRPPPSQESNPTSS